MAPEDLHALTERLLDTARERFLGDGAHESIAYLHVRGVTTFIAVTLSAAEDRAVVRRIFEAAAREGAEACALVTEARSGEGRGAPGGGGRQPRRAHAPGADRRADARGY